MSFLGNTYFPISFLGNYLNLDLSLVFIIPLIFACGLYWSNFAGIVCALFVFAWSANGGWIGVIFNIVVNVAIINFIYLIYFVCLKKTKLIFYIKLLITFVLTLIFMMLFCSATNGILFTPLYWQWYGYMKTISFIEAEKIYNQNPTIWLLYIPNYWGGIFALYSSFNAFKFATVFIILYPALCSLIRAKIIDKYFFTKLYESKEKLKNSKMVTN